ncbi:hypothetical protein SAMN06265337_1971 [Hymenobacter gelipurpurascens]|uniref:Uncharacterized protein n=1 Tax=Hymenobacter gelipurpurascens TaxID=89968 RepID=A0A212TNC4_9BACT|nr:hypothetical protein [Hymenobacter gelipurpurascens]SNC67495.1 hypothetical protein SAMN06265337_1971 [Hymenobacter gelipurpurascens]
MLVTLHAIIKLDKLPYTETIMGGPVEYERIAPLFAFYNVELEIANRRIILETEIRDFGNGIGVDWDSDDFRELLYTHLKFTGVNKVYALVSESTWRIYTNEQIHFPVSLLLDPIDAAKQM